MNDAPLLDLTRFPVVRFMPDRLREIIDYERLDAEWAALIIRGEPFLLVAEGAHDEAEDRSLARRRAQFFKERLPDMTRLCRATCVIEPDDARRAALDVAAAAIRRKIGVTLDYVAAPAEAENWIARQRARL